MKIIAQKAPKEIKTLSAEDKQQDYYKGFRSGVVLIWIFSNLVLAAAILITDVDDLDVSDPNQSEQQRAVIYMKVILYSVAGLSLFRFIGAMWFLILRLVGRATAFHTPSLANPFCSSAVSKRNLGRYAYQSISWVGIEGMGIIFFGAYARCSLLESHRIEEARLHALYSMVLGALMTPLMIVWEKSARNCYEEHVLYCKHPIPEHPCNSTNMFSLPS